MKLSVIIPCHPRNLPTLPRTLRSLDAAAAEWRGEVERLVVDDDESRGLSWARNRGLDRATGDVVFFVDADDTVRPGYFRALTQLLEAANADLAISSFDYAPLKRDYDLNGNAAVRTALLPAFFGYSFEDVLRWNRGGELAARREQGGVWRCAFRRAFLERHRLRFDENLFLYEDAPFLAECAGYATRVVSTREALYDYAPGAGGILSSSPRGSEAYRAYKFAALANRKAIAARIGQEVLEQFRGSAAFSALEFLSDGRLGELRRYLADPFVRESLRGFPLSCRHPLVAAAILLLKTAFPSTL